MKDIFEDKEMKYIAKWTPRSCKSYTMDELDDVRPEALGYIQRFVY